MPLALLKIGPQLCHAVAEPPTGPGWVHEIKHDGHRIIAYLDRGDVRLVTRDGNNATRRFAPVATSLERLRVKQAIIDGEVAVPDERGVTHIDNPSTALRHSPERLAFYAFDLLWLDGEDLRRRPLIERKAKLEKLLGRAPERIVIAIIGSATGSPSSARWASLAARALSPSVPVRPTPRACPRPG